nr:AlpA family phage regulatory protein [Bartonella bovis]
MIFMMGDNRYVITRECAQLFSMSTTTIRNWAIRGVFPQPYKLGKSVRWRKKCLGISVKEN